MLKLILAISALLSGTLALWIDPKASPRGRTILFVVLIGIFVATALDDRQSATDEGKRDGKIDLLNDQNDKLFYSIQHLQISQDEGFKKVNEQLLKQGYKPSEILNTSIADANASSQANTAYERAVVSWTSAGQKPSSTQLQYFPKNVDPAVVIQALKDVGFNPSQGSAELPGIPTNSLFVGLPVPVDDVKRVAFALMRAGIKIRQIARFSVKSRHPEHRNANLIQVGSDAAVVKDPVYSVEQVEALTNVGERIHD